MLDLEEMQFELLGDPDTPDDGWGFGVGLAESVNDDGFDPGGTDWIDQDSQSSTRGINNFGVDRLVGPTWTWTSHINRADTVGALESLGYASTAWRNNAIVNQAGAVTALRYQMGGRTRRVFGRPRKFNAPPNNMILSGYVPITKDFKCVDGYSYDDSLSAFTLTARLSAPPTLKFPLVFPIKATAINNGDVPVNIDGDAHTYPVVRFRGPVTNPYLATKDWTLALNISLADDQYVTVDLRPWALSVMRNDVDPVPGSIDRSVWLEDLYLEPGDNTLSFGGTGDSSGAVCDVEWRSAWNSL